MAISSEHCVSNNDSRSLCIIGANERESDICAERCSQLRVRDQLTLRRPSCHACSIFRRVIVHDVTQALPSNANVIVLPVLVIRIVLQRPLTDGAVILLPSFSTMRKASKQDPG